MIICENSKQMIEYIQVLTDGQYVLEITSLTEGDAAIGL